MTDYFYFIILIMYRENYTDLYLRAPFAALIWTKVFAECDRLNWTMLSFCSETDNMWPIINYLTIDCEKTEKYEPAPLTDSFYK